jgi:hypothetical protein
MLLKASILHKGGKIKERRATQTIGFESCVRKAFSDGEIKFLTEDEVLTLQSLNGLRDAAQHYTLEISEQHLYFQAQSGLTLFRDMVKRVFDMYPPKKGEPTNNIEDLLLHNRKPEGSFFDLGKM